MSNEGKTGKRETILLLLVLIATLALSLISIHIPFARDQGVAAYIASMILDGKAPYKDIYHFNLPGIFFTYALAFKIFGQSVEAINLFDTLYRIVTLLAVWALARRLGGWRTGIWAGFLYGIFSTLMYNDYWDIAQKETFSVLPLCLAASLTISGKGSRIRRYSSLFLSGLFSAGACYFKPTLGLAFLVILGYVWLKHEGTSKDRLIKAAYAVAGFAFAWIPLFIYLAAHHALQEFVEGVFIFGLFYGGQRYSELIAVLGLPVLKTARWLFDWRFLAGASILGIAITIRDRSPGWGFIMVWGLAIYLNVLVQMKFFTYHWIPLLAPLALLSGKGLSELLEGFPRRGSDITHWAVCILAFFLFIGNLHPHAKRYRREALYDFGLISKDDFLKPHGKWGFGDICVRSSLAVADYLKTHTSEDDTVLVFSLETGINFLADRRAPTRFAYDQPLTADPRGKERFEIYQRNIRIEFMSGLNREPPVYVAVVENDTSVIEPHDSYQQMQEFAEFRDWLYDHYFLETKIEHYYLFRVKPLAFEGL